MPVSRSTRGESSGAKPSQLKAVPTIGVFFKSATRRQAGVALTSEIPSPFATSLRFPPLHADHLLGAHILECERRIVRREPKPKGPISCHVEAFRPRELLDFPAGNRHPIDIGDVRAAEEVEKAAVMRPAGVRHKPTDQLRPFRGFEVEEFQSTRIQKQGGQISSVGRPAGQGSPGRTEVTELASRGRKYPRILCREGRAASHRARGRANRCRRRQSR